MPTIENMTPFPGTPDDLVTVTGVDVGVCTQIVLTYTAPSGSGQGVAVQSISAALTRVSQTSVTFTMPDFELAAPAAVKAKLLFTLNNAQQFTASYNFEAGPTSVTPPPAEPPPPQYGYGIPNLPMAYPIQRVPWVFHDPYDDDPDTNTWSLPLNPNKMTSPFPQRAFNTAVTTAVTGQSLVSEGMSKPKQWQFSGALFTAGEYDLMRSWVYDRNRRITITDHFGRDIVCALLEFDAQPVRAVSKYWRHDYTVTALVFSVGQPTRVPA